MYGLDVHAPKVTKQPSYFKTKGFSVLSIRYHVCIASKGDRQFLRKFSFSYLVLDEAHMVKNMATLKFKYLMKINVRKHVICPGGM
jgi:SWI/SNF-related matrix-associated actin-dependent regulator 1 of chromatin subfamily A